MSSKSSALKNQIVALVFNGTALPWANSELFLALHTADPGANGDQTINEATYTGYERVALSRGVGGWLVVGNQTSNAVAVVFPECGGGSNTITHVSVGLAASGASQVLHRLTMEDSMTISNAITPRFLPGTLVVIEE